MNKFTLFPYDKKKDAKEIKEMSLSEIACNLRGYALECGGEHHTYEDIENHLTLLSDAIYDKLERLGIGLYEQKKDYYEFLGIDDDYIQSVRKKNNIEHHTNKKR